MNANQFDDAQHPRGDGGRFSTKQHSETDVSLDATGTGVASAAPAELSHTPFDPADNADIHLARRASGAALQSLIEDADTHALTEAVHNPDLTSEQIIELADHSQPVLVRRSVATLPHSGVADIASHDPDVFVRMTALEGWDLSPANRARLQRDPVVQKMRRIVAV